MSDWKEYSFSELLSEPVRNGIYKTKEFHGRGQKIVNMGELFANPRLFDIEMKRVELNENDFKKALLKEGDLIFARRSLTAEGAGKCSIVKRINEDTSFESSLIRARPNKSLCNSDFLYYYFSSYQGKNAMYGIMRQVAVAGITGSDLMKLRLEIPSLPEQKSIAHILGKLDDKIELNRQMNQTLEAMAQALFKSWFVDFDPVMDNALASNQEIPDELQAMAEKRQLIANRTVIASDEGARQSHQANSKRLIDTNPELAAKFPSSFVFNETLGKWIPEGWKVKAVEDAIHVNPFVSIKMGEVRKYVDMKALPTSGYSIDGFIEKEYSGGAKFKQGDVLLARITPCLENGKTAIVDFLENDEAAFGSTEFIILRGKNQIKTPFIACLARFEAFVNHCIQNMVGSSGRQRVQNSCFNSYFLALPENELLKKFDLLTNPYFKKITDNSSETKTLTELRDNLLPELISGRVRVKELDEWTEQKLAMVAEKRPIYNSKS
ncbi:restriction endonuclease subunit S [Algoriphagus yeomjeoni]|uniref:restriction endonuclease subunit S n=1 Tax=Algoriphagus yeomjeoni TaxID=291403 RepID=UPI003CE571F4